MDTNYDDALIGIATGFAAEAVATTPSRPKKPKAPAKPKSPKTTAPAKRVKDVGKTMVFRPYVARTANANLPVYTKADISATVLMRLRKNQNISIIEERDGFGLIKGFARLRNGWVEVSAITKL